MGRKIECEIKGFIENDFKGPTPAQRNFFLQIENTYASLTEKILLFLSSKRVLDARFDSKNFDEAFQLVYLLIPDCTAAPVQWEWSFEPLFDDSYTITVCMQDAIPSGVEVVA